MSIQMEKAVAPHSSTLAWKIPWMEEPGGLQSVGLRRVGHDWVTSLFTFMSWRRKWQPTPVFLPGESQGRGSLVGCCLWGHRVGHDWSDLAATAAAAAENCISVWGFAMRPPIWTCFSVFSYADDSRKCYSYILLNFMIKLSKMLGIAY